MLLNPHDAIHKNASWSRIGYENLLTPQLQLRGSMNDNLQLSPLAAGQDEECGAWKSDGEDDLAGRNAARRNMRRLIRRQEIDLDDKNSFPPSVWDAFSGRNILNSCKDNLVHN